MPKGKTRSISQTQPSFANIPPPEMKGPRKDTLVTQPVSQHPGRGGELFIVDNSEQEWKVAEYLREWCEIARAFDVATGYFEIGGLLALDGNWQKLDQIRILMGDEVNKRTQKAFNEALSRIETTLDASIEETKEKNDFLLGVPAIVQAIQSGKITCRVYRERKFHAKAYITHAKFDVMGATALVGSSNFTSPGLNENVELNVRLRSEVEILQQWYEKYWQEAEDVTPQILRVIERHIREYSPFEVYVKALSEYFKGHEISSEEWERAFPFYDQTLDHYQKEGYHALLKMVSRYRGALLCDSVGLGKTFIGIMLIARMLHDHKKVVLLSPKSARKPVWMSKLNRYLPDALDEFSGLRIYSHTDLLRGGEYVARMNSIALNADVILIDEAHHFRTRAAKTYKRLFEIAKGKTLFLLTATPVNNSLLDLQHMIELFSQRQADYFKAAPLGIYSLPGHFRKLETAVAKLAGEDGDAVEITTEEAERLLTDDPLFRALVVQRSRAYARQSAEQHGGAQVIFPERKPPQVAAYSLKRTYGPLLEHVDRAFRKEKKPLLALAMYNPLAYSRKDLETADEKWVENRQKQVVGLIRVQLLKRFESSARAFQATCEDLLMRLLAFAEVNSESDAEIRRLENWKADHQILLDAIRERRKELSGEGGDEEDVVSLELLEAAEELPRGEYKLGEILNDTFADLDQLVVFLNELQDFSPDRDDKLRVLIRMLQKEPLLSQHKVLIFSEYMATARYLARQLKEAGIDPLAEVDSGSKRDRGEIITEFSPYYNDSSSADLGALNRPETRVLISTDVLSEGLNLQDATLLINYDLHWNPVRLMQRIGRVDRRLDPETEARIVTDHPDRGPVRRTVHYWNFLPPGELDVLLNLYTRVAHKALRISKVFGIEGKKLLRPEDDFDALKEFNETYEGHPTRDEALRLYYLGLLKAQPSLEERINHFPLRVFSAKVHPDQGKQAVFFCYHLPAKDEETGEWDGEAGRTQWYLLDLATDRISEDSAEIDRIVRSDPATPRRRVLSDEALVAARKKVEAHIRNSYLKSVQAPADARATLKAWMELN